MLPVAILAGGLATRLGPLTKSRPKALVEVAGRPFIHWQLELLASEGVSRVVLCVGHLGEQIEAALGDGAEFGLRIQYSFDGPAPLGTGGALRRALPRLGPFFFVLYGDSYPRVCCAAAREAYERSGASALLTVFRNGGRWVPSNVLLSGDRVLIYDKDSPRNDMAHVDHGLGVLSARALEIFSDGVAFDLADLYRELSVRGELAGLEMSERFYEMGSFRGLAETARYLRGAADGLRKVSPRGSSRNHSSAR